MFPSRPYDLQVCSCPSQTQIQSPRRSRGSRPPVDVSTTPAWYRGDGGPYPGSVPTTLPVPDRCDRSWVQARTYVSGTGAGVSSEVIGREREN